MDREYTPEQWDAYGEGIMAGHKKFWGQFEDLDFEVPNPYPAKTALSTAWEDGYSTGWGDALAEYEN